MSMKDDVQQESLEKLKEVKPKHYLFGNAGGDYDVDSDIRVFRNATVPDTDIRAMSHPSAKSMDSLSKTTTKIMPMPAVESKELKDKKSEIANFFFIKQLTLLCLL